MQQPNGKQQNSHKIENHGNSGNSLLKGSYLNGNQKYKVSDDTCQ